MKFESVAILPGVVSADTSPNTMPTTKTVEEKDFIFCWFEKENEDEKL